MIDIPHKLVEKFKKYLRFKYCRYGWLDLDSVASNSLLEAYTKYDPAKYASLFGYLTWRAHYNVLSQVEDRDSACNRGDISCDSVAIVDLLEPCENSAREEFLADFDKAIQKVADKANVKNKWYVEAFKLAAIDGLSFSQISSKLNVSRELVYYAISSVRRKLQYEMKEWEDQSFSMVEDFPFYTTTIMAGTPDAGFFYDT